MKYILAIVIFLSACNSGDNEPDIVAEEPPTPLSAEEIYVWSVEMDSMRIRKNHNLPENYYQVDSIIKGLNSRYAQIQLQKIGQSNDTLYTHIPNAEHLTQRMGSAGPEMYFATMYFNLTSVPGIRYVNVDLVEGDHAGPGVYGPNSFKNFKVDSVRQLP